MFAEPLTINIDGAAQNFNRTVFGNPSKFQIPTGDLVLEINQTVAKSAERYNVRLTRTLLGPDALNPAVQRLYKRQYWFGSSGPLNGIGISDTQADKDVAGFLAWLGLAPTRTKLNGGES